MPHAVGNGDAVMYHDADTLGFFTDLPGGSKLAGQKKIAFAPSPGRNGPSNSNMWMWSLGLNAGSKQKDAAWLFMQWAAGKEHLLYAGTHHGHVDTMRNEYIRGVGKLDNRLIIMLDLARVISAGEKTELQSLGTAA